MAKAPKDPRKSPKPRQPAEPRTPKKADAGSRARSPESKAAWETIAQIDTLLQRLEGSPADTAQSPADRARDLLARARQERDPKNRVKFAHDALAVWPDCADAYVLIAGHAGTRRQAVEFLAAAVAAGTRAIGPDATFQQHVGRFWLVPETRPYMRARQELAFALWSAGRRDEAVAHLQDMLRLNPGDNQGVRYTLAGFLLFLDRDADTAALLDRYPEEDSAVWAYSRALLAFRRDGDTIDSRRLLKKAKKANAHVPGVLFSDSPLGQRPGPYSPGDENEAVNYVDLFRPVWKDTAGAVAWLRENQKPKRKPRPPADQPAVRPLAHKALARMSKTDEVWQADFRRLPAWVPGDAEDGTMTRPSMLVVVNTADGTVLGHEIIDEVTANDLWDRFSGAVRHPLVGSGRLPAELAVRGDHRWEALRPDIEALGVRLNAGHPLTELDQVFAGVNAHIFGPQEPGLLDVPGVTPDIVAGFYDAAARFFDAKPWKKVGFESAVRVGCDRFESGPWYAVLMGQSGLATGVALYEDLATLRAMWSSAEDQDRAAVSALGSPDENQTLERNARESVALTVTFGEPWEIPVADLDAAARHGWKVARPDAHLAVMYKERGLTTRPPLAWQIALSEGILRALPDFVTRRPQADPTPDTVTVPVSTGPLELVLSWVPEEST